MLIAEALSLTLKQNCDWTLIHKLHIHDCSELSGFYPPRGPITEHGHKVLVQRYRNLGGAASIKLGLRPFLTSPYSVNWLTTRSPPPTSFSERFIFPSASGKTLSPTTLSAIQVASISPSLALKPTKRTKPVPISPTDRPSTVTCADDTRWRTTFKSQLLHSHRLSEISRLVDIRTSDHCHVVG